MRTFFALGLALVGAAGVVVVWRGTPREAPRGLAAIRVTEGFRVEKVAGPPLVSYPMLGTLDDRGRMFLCESSGHTLNNKQMAANPDYRIRLLEDTNGDGVYDRSKVFADRLTLPAGAVWLNGSLYVASPPDLLRFDDLNNDGIADRKEVVLTGWVMSANAASLHGPILGPDGWLYLTDGRHGFNIKTKEGTVLSGKASRIWRCRPDGTGLESFAGGGFDNPVEVVFTPSGEMIGTMTYFTDPKDGQRDALLHFVEGGVYPKPHPTAVEFKRTGDWMPVMTKFARIAPSGLLRYDGGSLGAGFHSNLFSTHFNSHRVQRHRMSREGATFRTEDEDFLTSTDPDFHPTDVMQAADGSLLVVDTGGWFIHGCPVSRLSKPEVQGGIYRVRREAAPARWTRPPAETRAAAIFELAKRGDLAGVRRALEDTGFEVRVAAARAAGMARDRAAVDRLLEMVRSDELPARRQAATALGQIGDPRAVSGLLAATAGVEDRFVEHAMIYSLIQLGQPQPLLTGLGHRDPAVRKAALSALDQMDGNRLDRKLAARLLGDPNPQVRDAALWVVSHHPDWAGEVAGFLRTSFLRTPTGSLESVRPALVAFAADPQVQAIVAGQPSLLLDVIEQSSLKGFPAVWLTPLGRLVESGDLPVRLRAVSLIRSRGIAGLDDRLEKITEPAELRVAVLGALVERRPELDRERLEFLARLLDPSTDAMLRQGAAQVLGRARLDDPQLLALSQRDLAKADPLILPALLEAFRHSTSEVAGQALVEVLRRAPAAASSIGLDRLKQLLGRYPAPVQAAAKPVFERFRDEQRERLDRLRKLEPLLTAAGDLDRGRRIFFGSKVACSSCHTIGTEGGHVGPDLTAVGAVRSGFDLLEAIVFPSASFVPGHEIYRVETDNDVISGVMGNRSGDAVVLVTGPNGEVRIPRSRIRSMKQSPVSLMPEGLDESLTPQEFTDLLAYLQAQTSRPQLAAGGAGGRQRP